MLSGSCIQLTLCLALQIVWNMSCFSLSSLLPGLSLRSRWIALLCFNTWLPHCALLGSICVGIQILHFHLLGWLAWRRICLNYIDGSLQISYLPFISLTTYPLMLSPTLHSTVLSSCLLLSILSVAPVALSLSLSLCPTLPALASESAPPCSQQLLSCASQSHSPLSQPPCLLIREGGLKKGFNLVFVQIQPPFFG